MAIFHAPNLLPKQKWKVAAHYPLKQYGVYLPVEEEVEGGRPLPTQTTLGLTCYPNSCGRWPPTTQTEVEGGRPPPTIKEKPYERILGKILSIFVD